MKKYIVRTMCILMLSCMFSGCAVSAESQLREQQEGELSEGTNMENDKTKEEIKEDLSDETESDKLPYEGNMSETIKDDENNLGEKVNHQNNTTFEPLENYKESSILSVYTQDNDNEYYCNALLNQDNEVEYYTVAKEEDGYYIWRYTLREGVTKEEAEGNPDFWVYKKGAAWEREPVLWLEGIKAEIDQGRVFYLRGEDKNEYAWYMASGEKSHLVKRNGDSYVEIPLSGWNITEQATVAVLANGNVVSADLGRECNVYNPENGSLLTSFRCGWYESICVRGNTIYISTHGGESVQRYDAEKQEFLPVIEAAFDNSVRIAQQEDDVYVCTPGGFYRAKETDTCFQKVLEAGTFHFSKKSGVLLKFFVVGDTFYIVYGEDRTIIKKYSLAGEEEGASSYMTVYSLKSNDLILDMISEFQDQYPDVELIYETGEGADGSVTMSDRIRALNARILAGDGSDVLLLDGLPVDSYIEKGILGDLAPVLGLEKEKLLPNILSAYTKEDKIYMLPLRVNIPLFMTSGQNPEKFSDLESLVEYSEAEGGVANLLDYSYANMLQILYYNYKPDFIMEDGVVNREAVVQFFSLVKRFCESEQITETAIGTTPYLEGHSLTGTLFEEGGSSLVLIVGNGAYELSIYPASVKARGGELVGNHGIFIPNGLLGLNNLSDKKDISNLFINFAFSYEIQNRDVSRNGYPIYSKILEEFTQLDLSHVERYNGKTTLRWFNAEESAQMVQVVREAYIPVTIEENVWEILLEVAGNYLSDKKGLDESVDEFVSRLQLYLYEQ